MAASVTRYDNEGELLLTSMRERENREEEQDVNELQRQIHMAALQRAQTLQTIGCGRCAFQSKFSLWSWIFMISHACGLTVLISYAPELAIGCFVVLIPVLILAICTRFHMPHASPNDTVWCLSVGYFPAVACAAIFGTLLRVTIQFLCLGTFAIYPFYPPSNEQQIEEFPVVWQRWGVPFPVLWYISRALNCFLAAAWVQEYIKYQLCKRLRSYLSSTDPCLTVFYSISAAVGFATAESFSYVGDSTDRAGLWVGVVVALIRLLTPLHVITMLSISSDYCQYLFFTAESPHDSGPVFAFLFPPIFLHGSFDLALTLVPSQPMQQLQWTITLCVVAIVCFGCAVWMAMYKYWKLRQIIDRLLVEPVF